MIGALKPSCPGAFLELKDEMTDDSSSVVNGGSFVEFDRSELERLRSDCCEDVSVEGSSSRKYCVRRRSAVSAGMEVIMPVLVLRTVVGTVTWGDE